MKNFPKELTHLYSTYNMLKKTYPNFDLGDDYFMVIRLLYDEMSDRNLAKVLEFFSSKNSHEIINDIYKSCDMKLDCNLVKIKLQKNGYDNWLFE